MTVTKYTVATKDAKSVLADAWETVCDEDISEVEHALSQNLRESIATVLMSDELAYRYLLVVAAVSKATEEGIHYQSLKRKEFPEEGGYAPRTPSKKVVAPWNLKVAGNRLEMSREPLSGNPTQSYPKFEREPNTDADDIRAELVGLLETFQERTSTGDLTSDEILLDVLREVKRLPTREPDFEGVGETVTYQAAATQLRAFLETSSGGARLMAVSAGLLHTCYGSDQNEVLVQVDHENAADKPRNVAGDVQLQVSDEVHLSVEVRDQTIDVDAVRYGLAKAASHDIPQYMFIAESFKNRSECMSLVKSEPIDGLLVTVDELLGWLKPMDGTTRTEAFDQIGDALKQMNAHEKVTDAWQDVMKPLR